MFFLLLCCLDNLFISEFSSKKGEAPGQLKQVQLVCPVETDWLCCSLDAADGHHTAVTSSRFWWFCCFFSRDFTSCCCSCCSRMRLHLIWPTTGITVARVMDVSDDDDEMSNGQMEAERKVARWAESNQFSPDPSIAAVVGWWLVEWLAMLPHGRAVLGSVPATTIILGEILLFPFVLSLT